MTANIALYGNCLRTSFVQDSIGEMIGIFKTLLMPVTIFKIVVLIKFGYNARRHWLKERAVSDYKTKSWAKSTSVTVAEFYGDVIPCNLCSCEFSCRSFINQKVIVTCFMGEQSIGTIKQRAELNPHQSPWPSFTAMSSRAIFVPVNLAVVHS